MKIFLKSLIFASALLGISACGGSDSEEATLRVIHASPDASNIDFAVDNKVLLSDAEYTAVSAKLSVDAGERKIEVRPAGKTTPVIEATLDLAASSSTTIITIDKISDIRALVLTNNTDAPVTGKAKLRVVHSAASAPKVDIYLIPFTSTINDAEPTLRNVPFGVASSYLEVTSGQYRAVVTVAGTKNIAIDSGVLDIPTGLIASILALDAPGGGAPFSLQVVDETR